MKRTAIIVGLLMVVGSIPAATTAEHMSVGVEDAVATRSAATETPSNPSVVGTTEGDKSTPFGIGTATDCFEPEGNLSAQEANQARQADGFCGELVYHEGQKAQVESNPDQDLREPITRWDVIRTLTATDIFIAEFCTVFCSPTIFGIPNPGADTVWNGVHAAGNAAGVTEDGGTADSKTSDRDQAYDVGVSFLSASRVVQSSTGLWRMNGWITPSSSSTFYGFLEGPGGDVITKSDLQTIVQREAGNSLHPDTPAVVCGYTPDIEFTGGGIDTSCEIPFEYREPADPDPHFRDGYNNRCESPTYVCNAAQGPAWTSGSVISGSWLEDSQGTYLKWHFVVAPHDSDCNGAQEPEFSFEGDGFPNPYLAHDVDVFTPVTDAQGVPNGEATPAVADYGLAVSSNAEGEANEAVGEAVSSVPGLPSQVQDAVNATVRTALNASLTVQKADRVEPNNAEAVGGLDDTSQHLLPDSQLERTLDGKCAVLTSDETKETVDPWVDRVDSQAVVYPGVNSFSGLYGNADATQDGTNNPTPSGYFSSGQVGMFTDKDDDGDYDAIGDTTRKYDPGAISSNGAYPMFWDMRLSDPSTIDTSNGCTVGDKPFPQLMRDSGYGPNTGLVQAVYLQEPSAFFTTSGSQVQVADKVAPYPAGNNIYLLMSQSAKVQYEQDSGQLDSEIDGLVSDLKQYADAKNGEALGQPDVVVPGDELGLSSDFLGQCGEETGGFTSAPNWLHQCETDCSGDTIVTMYAFELAQTTVGGGDSDLPVFTGASDVAGYSFGSGQHTWYDVDPFDGDSDRNDDECSRPDHTHNPPDAFADRPATERCNRI